MSAKLEVQKKTVAVISKFGTPAIIAKLEAKTLLGLSKTVAIEILNKRGLKDPIAKTAAEKYSGETWVAPKEPKASSPEVEVKEVSTEKEPKKDTSTTAEKLAPKAEKEKKEPKAKKAKAEKVASVEIDEADAKVKAILSNVDLNKSQKIKALLVLEYTPKQISKVESLGAIYQYCFNVMSKMKEKKEA